MKEICSHSGFLCSVYLQCKRSKCMRSNQSTTHWMNSCSNSALELQQVVWEMHTNSKFSSWSKITYLNGKALCFCLWSKSYTLWITVDAHWTNFLSWKPSLLEMMATTKSQVFITFFNTSVLQYFSNTFNYLYQELFMSSFRFQLLYLSSLFSQ